MNRTGGSPRTDSFTERVDLLFEELTFAVRNDRPSILLSFYDSEFVRQRVEDRLEARLGELDQQVLRLSPSKEQFDLPQQLSRRPDRGRTVYFIHALSLGGGKEDANAYRALNIRRELLVDYHIRSLFWLTRPEARDLSRHAPDFWAFRHRVVEFNRPADINRLDLAEAGVSLSALRAARRAARLAPDEAVPWLELGTLCLKAGLLPQARQAFLRLLALAPRHPQGWLGLAQVYRLGQHPADAIIKYRQVIQLEPQNIPAQIGLIACYRLLGQTEPAGEQIKAIQPSMASASEYVQARLAAVCGNTSQAVELLRRALEKQQVHSNELKYDPDLERIRSEAGFIRLTASPSMGKQRGKGR